MVKRNCLVSFTKKTYWWWFAFAAGGHCIPEELVTFGKRVGRKKKVVNTVLVNNRFFGCISTCINLAEETNVS